MLQFTGQVRAAYGWVAGAVPAWTVPDASIAAASTETRYALTTLASLAPAPGISARAC